MGATSSGLLDETRTSSIRGRVDGMLQSFGGFYRQQYSAAYIGHLQQEVEPKKEGRGLLLTQAPPCAPDEVLHRCRVKSSCWDDDQGKKCRERLTVLRRRDRLEIHESLETFSRGSAATLVLQPAGGSVFTKEEESRAQLEMTCAAVLDGVKEASSSSSSVVSSPDMPAVYLLLPYMGRTCFLFQQEEERDHFLSALRTCIRHSNLDPWCDPSYERLAFVRALCLYRRDRGCYESWEKLLGSEEHVLASQVMEEVSSWLQSQIQSRLKGKKTERMRQWLATVQEAYVLVLDQLGPGLEALRLGCRRTALANQGLIRSNLDQITSSLCFLENKIRACVCEEAGRECRDSIGPYLSSVLDVLTGNISAAMQRMKEELSREMDVRQTGRETDGMKTVLAPLGSFRQVESLNLDLEDLSERFGRSSTQRLIQSAHLEVEKLMENAVYTFQLFLQSSRRLPVDKERAKELVLKQLDYDSRLVQMRLFHEALLEISLPALSRTLDTKWTSELQQLEHHIFSDVSSFILIHNVFEGVVRQVVSQEIQTAVQEAVVKKSAGLSLDASDLDVSQYCLLDPTPPCSAPGTPAVAARSSSPGPEGGGAVSPEACPQSPSDLNADPKSASSSPVLFVLEQFDEPASEGASLLEDIHLGTGKASMAESASSEPDRPDPPAGPGSTNLIPDPAELPESSESSSDVQPAPPETSTAPDLPAGGEDTPLWTHAPMKINLLSLSEAIGYSAALPVMQTTTDRAVYLTGGIKDSWEEETDRMGDRKQEETDRMGDRKQEETDRRRDRKQEETDRRRDRKHKETDRRRDRKQEATDRKQEGETDRKQEGETDRKQEGETDRKQEETDRRTDRKQSGRLPVDEESTAAFTTEQRECEEEEEGEEGNSETEGRKGEEEEDAEEGNKEKGGSPKPSANGVAAREVLRCLLDSTGDGGL